MTWTALAITLNATGLSHDLLFSDACKLSDSFGLFEHDWRRSDAGASKDGDGGATRPEARATTRHESAPWSRHEPAQHNFHMYKHKVPNTICEKSCQCKNSFPSLEITRLQDVNRLDDFCFTNNDPFLSISGYDAAGRMWRKKCTTYSPPKMFYDDFVGKVLAPMQMLMRSATYD